MPAGATAVTGRRLLVVYHSQTGGTARMAEAVARGAARAEDVEHVLRRAADATLQDLLTCHGLLVGTPENFGYMAGLVKDFFDRVYYPAEGKVQGLPYSVFVCAGNDGSGAMFNVDRIATGMRLKKVHPGVIAKGGAAGVDDAVLAKCEELGATLAAGISLGMF
jgi:multimeric flavodoxin WrbA